MVHKRALILEVPTDMPGKTNEIYFYAKKLGVGNIKSIFKNLSRQPSLSKTLTTHGTFSGSKVPSPHQPRNANEFTIESLLAAGKSSLVAASGKQGIVQKIDGEFDRKLLCVKTMKSRNVEDVLGWLNAYEVCRLVYGNQQTQLIVDQKDGQFIAHQIMPLLLLDCLDTPCYLEDFIQILFHKRALYQQ